MIYFCIKCANDTWKIVIAEHGAVKIVCSKCEHEFPVSIPWETFKK